MGRTCRSCPYSTLAREGVANEFGRFREGLRDGGAGTRRLDGFPGGLCRQGHRGMAERERGAWTDSPAGCVGGVIAAWRSGNAAPGRIPRRVVPAGSSRDGGAGCQFGI